MRSVFLLFVRTGSIKGRLRLPVRGLGVRIVYAEGFIPICGQTYKIRVVGVAPDPDTTSVGTGLVSPKKEQGVG